MVFQTSLGTLGAGALKAREDRSHYNTDKEKALFAPQSPFYEAQATACADKQVAVDLFLAPN